MVYGRLWEGCGPGMPGPYRGRLWGIRTVTGRPVKAPQAVCGCRSPSSFRRGFGCLRLRGFLRLRSVRIQIRLIVRDGLVQLVDFCLRGIAGGEQVGVLTVGVQGGLGVLQFSLCLGQAGVGLVNGSLRIDELLRVRQRGLGGGSGFISDAACQQGGLFGQGLLAAVLQHKVHGGESYVFYMDIRAAGKNYEEFVRRAIEDDGVNYVRGRVARVYEKDGKLIVKGVDTLMGAKPVEIEADMVVLATAGVSNEGAEELAQRLHVSYDPYKFFAEAHPKLKPVETNTAGIYVAGACQAPRDIPETVSMASGAAAKVAALFSSDKLVREPLIAVVNRMAPPVYSTCVGCFMCQTACPYQAIEREEIKDRGGNVVKTVARVNPGLCQGCGTCVAFCRSKSIDIQGYSNDQMYAEVMALLHTQGA